MTIGKYTPTFSIAIEWENARFAELERTRRMLRALRRELMALSPGAQAPQIVFLYDRFTIDGGLVARVVAEELRPCDLPARSEIVPTEGLRYYQQKNLGAALTSGEVIVFLDCDVVPEPGWLAAILDSFDDPNVDAVGGETYVELLGLTSRAFALFWFFGLRDEASDLSPTDLFHANNVAFRRDVFTAHPFPDLPIYRGQCTILGETLREGGLGLYRQKRARASHPYPLTAGYFTARALHNGRDAVIVAGLLPGNRASASWTSVWRTWWGQLGYAAHRLRRHRRDVTLSRLGALAALAIAGAYFTLRAIGAAVTIARPNLIARLFPI